MVNFFSFHEQIWESSFQLFTFASITEHLVNFLLISGEVFLEHLPAPRLGYCGVPLVYTAVYEFIAIAHYDSTGLYV